MLNWSRSVRGIRVRAGSGLGLWLELQRCSPVSFGVTGIMLTVPLTLTLTLRDMLTAPLTLTLSPSVTATSIDAGSTVDRPRPHACPTELQIRQDLRVRA